MKNIFLQLLILFCSTLGFAQVSNITKLEVQKKELIKQRNQEVQILENKKDNELLKIQDNPNFNDVQGSIKASYDNEINNVLIKYNNQISEIDKLVENETTKKRNLEIEQQATKNIYDTQTLQSLKNAQVESYNQFTNNITSSLNQMGNAFQQGAIMQAQAELRRRQNVANNFINYQSSRIGNLQKMYNSIPSSNFDKNLNGIFSAHLLVNKKLSLLNGQETVVETSCLVVVENNVVKNIYLYGYEEMELDYPKNNSQNSMISNGFVVYSDYESLETYTLLIIEPYLTNTPKSYSITKDKVAYVTVWSSDKDDEGKSIHIQELDKKGNVINETLTQIVYSKNEKSIDTQSTLKVPLNSNNSLLFFGEVTNTPLGLMSLYPKMSKSNFKPLKEAEHRLVKINKYRE